MTDITELAPAMKAAAKKYRLTLEAYRNNPRDYDTVVARDEATSEFMELVDNDELNIISGLVEALGKAQAKATQQGNIACALFDEVTQQRLHADEKAPELRAQLIEADSELEALRQRIAELESSGIAPGILRCTECSFVQTKNIISVTADIITTVESESEPCPNGCGQLQPVTWKALAIQLMFTTKQGVSDFLEAKKRIAELESRTVTAAAVDVLAERQRQVTTEGWAPAHDDEYEHGELADAAGCYALSSELFDCAGEPPRPWPWPDEWWKPTSRRRDLVKAGALILAEIERIDRAAGVDVREAE